MTRDEDAPPNGSISALQASIARFADAVERNERATTALSNEIAALRADSAATFVRKDVYNAEMTRLTELLDDKAWRSDVTAVELRTQQFVTEITSALKGVAETVKSHSANFTWAWRTVGALIITAVLTVVAAAGGGVRIG